MTRPQTDVLRALTLLDQGMSQAETARITGIPRGTIRYWVQQGGMQTANRRRRTIGPCDPCPHLEGLGEPSYAYLLGLYLGDGCISAYPRGVYRLRVVLDVRYPGIIAECRGAMVLVIPNRVSEVVRIGCVEVGSYSKHWPCLFPQHGAGPKHLRRIILQPWQERIALDRYPHLFLRGLIHSDGCRATNRIRGKYAYARYQFSNRSDDIKALFAEACRRVDIECKRSSRWVVSVSRRADVAKMDMFVGAKA